MKSASVVVKNAPAMSSGFLLVELHHLSIYCMISSSILELIPIVQTAQKQISGSNGLKLGNQYLISNL
jgi:hypothetical protein